MPVVAAALLIALYALCDRFVGGGAPKLDARLPGRSVAWAGLGLAVVGYLLGGPVLAVLGLAWAGYRSLPFKGATTPVSLGEIVRCAVRHGLIVPVAVFLAVGFHRSPVLAGIAFTLYAAAAVSLAAAYGRANQRQVDRVLMGLRPNRDMAGLNARVELARGAAFGAAAVLGFLVQFKAFP